MSIFSWFKSKPKPPQNSSLRSELLTVPRQAPAPAAAVAAPKNVAELKQQRQLRRDHLYSVVREAMLRSEVLASHYKFKVLSLDAAGRQFLIMVDLVEEPGFRPEQLTAIEHLIGSTAAQRHDLLVKAVYWRQTGTVAHVAHAAAPVAPKPAPVIAENVAAPTPRGRGGVKTQGFEPIGQDEVLAFKNAIAANKANAPATPAPSQPQVSGLRNAAAMSGFEDTQLLEPDDTASPLSSTQFGNL